MKKTSALLLTILFTSLAFSHLAMGSKKRSLPEEFNQKVQLKVPERIQEFQAQSVGYELGDLQAFHSQHTLPFTVKEMFEDIFSQVELVQGNQPRIESINEVPQPTFEVGFADIQYDQFMETRTHYQAEAAMVAIMRDPMGNVIWKKGFRGVGYVRVNTEYPDNFGPDQAITDAVNDALDQMEDAIIASPQVRGYLQTVKQAHEAAMRREVTA